MRMRWGLILAILCFPLPAYAGKLPEQFTLGRYVPGDVFLYIHSVHNPQRDWLDAKWAEVFDTFKQSGIDRDAVKILRLVLTDAFDFTSGDEDAADVEATIEKWSKLIGAVRWHDLMARELVFAERFTAPLKGFPDYFLLARGTPGSAEANLAALTAILGELASLSDKATVTSKDSDGVTVRVLEVAGKPDKPALKVSLLRKEAVIGVVFGNVAQQDVLGLLTGKSKNPSIVASPRLAEALDHVPAPRDQVMFFDARTMIHILQQTFSRLTARKAEAAVAAGKKQEAEAKNDRARTLRLFSAILAEVNSFDFTITSAETTGRRTFRHEVTRLQPGKEKTAVARCLYDRKPFERFDRYIPASATRYWLHGLVNLNVLYRSVIDLMETKVPAGVEHLEKWNGFLARFGFDPQRDFLRWWSGEMIYVEFPPAFVSPMGSNDWVVMFRVKDPELAAAKIHGAIDRLNASLSAHGQTLMIAPADVGTEGFREVTHPMMAMMARPVIGVHDEWLMLGRSAPAVRKCLEVAAGEAPSIREHARFKEEGLVPDGPVLGASFKDTSKWGQEMAQFVAMVGMFGGMVTAGIKGDKAEEMKEAVQTLVTAIAKLGPVFQKIDFYSSESSITTAESQGLYRCRRVVTYKPPSAVEPKGDNAR